MSFGLFGRIRGGNIQLQLGYHLVSSVEYAGTTSTPTWLSFGRCGRIRGYNIQLQLGYHLTAAVEYAGVLGNQPCMSFGRHTGCEGTEWVDMHFELVMGW